VNKLERDEFILGKDRLLLETTEVQKENEKLKLIESIQVDTIGKFEEAIGNLEKKVYKNQDNLIAWVFLSYLYRRLEHIDEADHAAKEVIRINPNFVISEFARNLQIKFQETRKRFIEYLKMVGLPVN
jgi:tetratricopeptide (TPR) repeat protein